MKSVLFWLKISLNSVPMVSLDKYISTGLGNGLVSNRRQANTWINGDEILRCHKAPLGHTQWMSLYAACSKLARNIPDSNVHGASMGPTWGRQDPDGLHVGHMNLAIWDVSYTTDREYRSVGNKIIIHRAIDCDVISRLSEIRRCVKIVFWSSFMDYHVT